MRFKEGDTVKIVRSDNPHFDGKDVGKVGIIERINGTGSPYTVAGSHSVWKGEELELIKEKDMYKQGDVLVSDEHSYGRIVQGMIGNIVLTTDDDNTHYARTESLKGLEVNGWKLKTETPTTELTIDQIAEKFDLKPGQVRIKKADA